MKTTLACALAVLLPVYSFAAPNPNDFVDSALEKEIQKILNNDVVVQSIRFQNERHKDLTQNKVEELDKLWRKQRKEEDQYFISATLANPLSAYLTRVQAHSNGRFVEIFIMDNKGLNVGQSATSSDFWQGDEGKWQKTYKQNKGSVFVDEAEHDSDINRWRAQYNVAVVDPASGENIGAATVELNLTELARLKGVEIND